MNKKQKNKGIPELRFPEFVKDGEWDEKVLSKITDSIFDGTHQTPTYVENGIPFFSVENIVSGNKNKFISREDYEIATNKNKPEKGDVLITRIGKIGVSTIVDWDYEFSIYVTLACIKKSKHFNSYYLHSYFQSNSYQKEIFSKSLLNAVPCKINMNELRETKVLLPHPQEQQKIAAFLSNLDELIDAHKKKSDLLKKHKKGLIQNLFPQDGEKVPGYRFPEFRDDGEWVVTESRELGDLINGLTYSPKDVREKGLLVLRSSNIQNGLIDLNDSVYVRQNIKGANLSKPDDILICVRNGSKNLIGKNAIIPKGMPLATHGAFMTVFRAKNPEFVLQLFQSDRYYKQVKADLGATINSINGKNFIKYEFPVPENPQEQQKIAATLSSLDELITAQTEKIELLQQHKKGLMQRLFPCPQT